MRFLCRLAMIGATILAFGVAPARPQAPADPKAAARAARLEEMASLLRDLRVTDPARPGQGPTPLRPEPLQRWTDPTRELGDGGIWAFGESGRPVALATMETYGEASKSSRVWACELISLAPGPISAGTAGNLAIYMGGDGPGATIPLRWTPKVPGVAFKPIPNAPPPAAAEAERLRQLKALAARFSAHELIDGPDGEVSRTDLRLLPRQAHRYADPASGLLDGAIFLFVHGTNPELLLLVEARKPAGGDRPAAWSFGCARLSTAGLSASLDGREAWARSFARQPDPDEPYYFIRAARPAKD